jgi:hypothetical protein
MIMLALHSHCFFYLEVNFIIYAIILQVNVIIYFILATKLIVMIWLYNMTLTGI